MPGLKKHSLCIVFSVILSGCGDRPQAPSLEKEQVVPIVKTVLGNLDDKPDWRQVAAIEPQQVVGKDGFVWQTEQFSDIRIIRYQVPGWERLSLKQKQLAYYLTQAGLAGRDIMWDQNYRHNLAIREILVSIYTQYNGNKSTLGWQRFETYLKRVWFSNGIHHHYSMLKFVPEFSRTYFEDIAKASGVIVSDILMEVIFNPELDAKKVELDPDKGLVENSAVNFYASDITTADVETYYKEMIHRGDLTPISYGLNSRLVKNSEGQIHEHVWKLGAMYSDAIAEIISWLERAVVVAENEPQERTLKKLIKYYRSGDLKSWDEYNILWTNATEGDIDYINGFVEVYDDPLGYHGSFESIVQIKDFESSSRMKVLMDNADWFERNSPIMHEHKRKAVVGVSYNVVNIVSESGDASPSSPSGVNLPNADWIRARHGSKSVSLGNVQNAYRESSGSKLVEEFAHDQQEIDWHKAYGAISRPLNTALHEVIGHASGKIEAGVGTPKETLKSYSSTLEEGRADLIALYYSLDPKMVEMGLLQSLDAARYGYDRFIRNGLLAQLRRLELGADIEESHMRNRAWISRWVFEKGMPDNVIVKVKRDGKTYYDIRDYQKLRELFGLLLREVQRIKSQGDYKAVKALVENYGIKVDSEIHKEVLERAERLDIAPYGGFINPLLKPVVDSEGNMTDIELVYVDDFAEQMLYYDKNYSYLSR